MRRIATMTATAALLLGFPAAASAADSVSVVFGVLTPGTTAGQTDTVTIKDGGTAYPGRILVKDSTSSTGTPGYGCVSAGADGVSCDAGIVFTINLYAGDLDDSLTVDVARASWIEGDDGNDSLLGSPLGDTVIKGGAGNDTIDGRGGSDNVYGGDGDDRINSVDGVKDDVDCGAGDDRATVDPIDVVVGCETDPVAGELPGGIDAGGGPKKELPGGGTVPALPGGGSTPAEILAQVRIAVLNEIAKVAANGVAALTLGCAATELAGCEGVVYLDPAGQAKGKGKGKAKGKAKGHGKKVRALMARRGRYGKSPFTVAAGKSRNLQVTLSPLARKKLGLSRSAGKARASRRGRRLKAVVTVVQKGHAAKRSVVELRG